MTTRRRLYVGQKVTMADGTRGTVVPTADRVPDAEVNVMLDHVGSVITVPVDSLETD